MFKTAGGFSVYPGVFAVKDIKRNGRLALKFQK
jgi:hypothetical protein